MVNQPKTRLLVCRSQMQADAIARHFPDFHVIGPRKPLAGMRFDTVLVVSRAESPEESIRTHAWVEESVRCRLAPGGTLVYL